MLKVLVCQHYANQAEMYLESTESMESMWIPCHSCSRQIPEIPWNMHGFHMDSTRIPCTFFSVFWAIWTILKLQGIHVDSMELPHGMQGIHKE